MEQPAASLRNGAECRAASTGPWTTRDGAPVLIRSMRAADYRPLRELVHALSSESRYRRYLSPRTPSDEEISRWAAIDASHEFSLVAVARDSGGRLLGEARYVIESAEEADFAVMVADPWQRQGLGRELTTRLISAARCDGLLRLTAIAFSSNTAVLALARKLGFRFARTPGAGWETKLNLDLGA